MTQSGLSAAIRLATRTASLEPPAAGDEMISAPHISRSWRRSAEVFSGMTHTRRYPRSLAAIAREMPVLPEVGSRIVQPGVSAPSFSARSIIHMAGRSLTEPVGLRSSSFAHRRTSGVGDNRGNPTNGVPPSESASESNRTLPLRGAPRPGLGTVPRRAGPGGSPGDGRKDRHRVAVGHVRLEAGEEAYV